MSYESCPECGHQKHQLVACPSCGYYRNKAKRDRAHKKATQDKRSQERTRGGWVGRSGNQTPGKSVGGKSKGRREQGNECKKLRLVSKRGTLIREWEKCSSCGKPKNPVWRYAKSSRGQAFLCQACKEDVWRRSFGSASMDAMHRTFLGHFEGNRRRH